MTLQQLEYIVALEKHGHFQLAADACGITQPTLSATIAKLEEELDTIIFDRRKHPIEPTDAGKKVLAQAKVVLFNSAQLKEIVLSEREQTIGDVSLGVIPTIAPYILPGLIKEVHSHNEGLNLHITEASTANLIPSLVKAQLDMALMATPLSNPDLLEIPIYYEKFVAYVSPSHRLYKKSQIHSNDLTGEQLWILREEHCLSNQVLNLCQLASNYSTIYRAGSITTLINIVDQNGGYTVIPELHLSLLHTDQKANIRPIVEPDPVREVSLVIRKDYIKEKLLNLVIDNIKRVIPDHMIDSRLKKYAIKI
ncbi:MAG: hydrogen peroxide-inducible genes activator [Bacteroidales bacterium]|nr:hydrogen peroxide-inducible genes activator [Bacteroidales bacterium]